VSPTSPQRIACAFRCTRIGSSRRSSPKSDYLEYLETRGRGWVIEIASEIVGFAIGNATDGNVWVLFVHFVHPDHKRRGHGQQLHDVTVAWLWEQGVPNWG
jgi:GNAT superfamily N-acetyltransferase